MPGGGPLQQGDQFLNTHQPAHTLPPEGGGQLPETPAGWMRGRLCPQQEFYSWQPEQDRSWHQNMKTTLFTLGKLKDT